MDANHFMGLSKDEVVSVCIFRAGVLFGFFSSLFCIAGVFPGLHSELTPSQNNEDPRVGSLLQFFFTCPYTKVVRISYKQTEKSCDTIEISDSHGPVMHNETNRYSEVHPLHTTQLGSYMSAGSPPPNVGISYAFIYIRCCNTTTTIIYSHTYVRFEISAY